MNKKIKQALLDLLLAWIYALQSPHRLLGIVLLIIGLCFHNDIVQIIKIIAPNIDGGTVNVIVSAITGGLIFGGNKK